MSLFRLFILHVVFFSLFFSGCQNNYSTSDLTHDVRMNITEEWDRLGITGIRITDFYLIHEQGNKYKGLLTTYETDEYGYSDEFRYTVDVTFDGDYFMWEILPY